MVGKEGLLNTFFCNISDLLILVSGVVLSKLLIECKNCGPLRKRATKEKVEAPWNWINQFTEEATPMMRSSTMEMLIDSEFAIPMLEAVVDQLCLLPTWGEGWCSGHFEGHPCYYRHLPCPRWLQPMVTWKDDNPNNTRFGNVNTVQEMLLPYVCNIFLCIHFITKHGRMGSVPERIPFFSDREADRLPPLLALKMWTFLVLLFPLTKMRRTRQKPVSRRSSGEADGGDVHDANHEHRAEAS